MQCVFPNETKRVGDRTISFPAKARLSHPANNAATAEYGDN
jgi:hypothetical protein